MKTPPKPEDQEARALALASRGILDTATQPIAAQEGASRVVLDDEIAHLVPGYLAECALRVAGVRGAVQRGDFAEVKAHAHNLRGTGSSFGFPLITDSGARLEQAVAARDLHAIAREAAALQIYLDT